MSKFGILVIILTMIRFDTILQTCLVLFQYDVIWYDSANVTSIFFSSGCKQRQFHVRNTKFAKNPDLWQINRWYKISLQTKKSSDLCPIHVVTLILISNLVSDYIQKRRGEPGLSSFEYNLLPIHEYKVLQKGQRSFLNPF